MYKLMILIGPVADTPEFDESWPQFLHLAESMPKLNHEATVRVQTILYGGYQINMIHELFFKTHDDLQQALASTQGQAAGRTLQRITDGQMMLLTAEHKEDHIINLRRHQRGISDADSG